MAFRINPTYRFQFFCAQKVQQQNNEQSYQHFWQTAYQSLYYVFSTQACCFLQKYFLIFVVDIPSKSSFFVSLIIFQLYYVDVVLAYNSDIKYSLCSLLNYCVSMHLLSINLIIDQNLVSAIHQLYIVDHYSTNKLHNYTQFHKII